MEYDDGVYYGAARAIAHGLVPYRDFTVVHPPLTSVLLLPAAGIGNLLGDPVGIASARVEVLLAECLNVVLVFLVTRALSRGSHRYRTVAPWCAAALYAVAPGAVTAGHTVLLEPFTTMFCLLGMLWLRRAPASLATAAGGASLAAAVGVKAFAMVYVLVAACWLAATARDKLLLAAAGFGAGVAVTFGPVVVLAGLPEVWRDLVMTQLSRPSDGGISAGGRLRSLFGLAHIPSVVGYSLLVLLVAGLCAVALSAGRWSSRVGADAWVWPAVTVVAVAAFMKSPSYFEHYGSFVAAPLAVSVGLAIAAASLAGLPARLLAVVPVVGLLAMSGFTSARADVRWRAGTDMGAARSMISPGACIYSDAISLPVAADRFRLPSSQCPGWLDGRGQNLVWSVGRASDPQFYPRGFLSDARWQAQTLRQLEAASYLLVRSDPLSMPEWSPAIRTYAGRHFHLIWMGRGGRIAAQLWTRVN